MPPPILRKMKEESEKQAFAARLNEICDDKNVPPKGKARQTKVSAEFGVSQKGARKWLEGEGYPSTDKAIQIAKWAGVHFEWLMTGRGPKKMLQYPMSRQREHAFTLMEKLPEEKVPGAVTFLAVYAEPTSDPERNGTDG